jgi:hypothetical protein
MQRSQPSRQPVRVSGWIHRTPNSAAVICRRVKYHRKLFNITITENGYVLIERIGEVRWQEVAEQLECRLSLQSRSACCLYSIRTVKFNEYLPSLFYSPPNLWLPCFNSLYFSLFFPFGLFYSANFPFTFLSLFLFLPPCLFYSISLFMLLRAVSLYLSLSPSLFPCLLSSFLPSVFYHVLTSYLSGLSHNVR